MEWFEQYKRRVEKVFHLALGRIGEFPPPLNQTGLKYADKFHPANSESGQDYICLLLPFWMKESADISDEQCERLALANVYGMLYFFIQDDVMDSKAPERLKEQLALANLLQLEMVSVFRGLFPSDSPFWTYFGRYVTIWADCVVNEGAADFFTKDPIRTAGKAAPVKLSSTGACLLARRESLIPKVEAAVDLALMTLQMLDDWADWQEDLDDGSYNGLLSMIAQEVGAKAGELSKEKVETQIYVLGCMERYAAIAKTNHIRLLELGLHLPSLLNYHAYMVECLSRIAETIESRKRKLLGGGINLLLS